MRKRPPGITPGLVRRALEGRDPVAQRRLGSLLRQPFDDLPAFDGLVAYSDSRRPRLLSLATDGTVRGETLRSATGEDAWGATFCHVLPPIRRGP